MTENYINHPTFGLLFRVCQIGDMEIFTTVYPGRYFFEVKLSDADIIFEPLSPTRAREQLESHLTYLRQTRQDETYSELLNTFQKLFA